MVVADLKGELQMLIMNDTTAVNNIFEKEYDDMNVAQMVTLLCKYYTKKEELSPSSIKEKISNFLKYDLHRKDFDDWGLFVDKSILSPINCHRTLSKINVNIYNYFCALNSSLLIYISVLMPLPHNLECFCSNFEF